MNILYTILVIIIGLACIARWKTTTTRSEEEVDMRRTVTTTVQTQVTCLGITLWNNVKTDVKVSYVD